MSATIVIADDHPLMRDGLGALFASAGYDVVAHCVDGEAAKAAILAHRPTLAVLDISMPGATGVEVLRWARANGLPTRIVLITAGLDAGQLTEGVEGGADGLVLKDAEPGVILACVEGAIAGTPWIDRSVMALVLDHMTKAKAEPVSVLTPREQEIATLVAGGLRNKDIARDLGISEGTVKMHLHNLYQKLGIESRTELVLHESRRRG
jgi:two-component system, NarL family, nitrate/nitrite response regulator NarL